MLQMSIREANQNFSRLVAEVERGETVLITKNGRPVARMTPQPADPMQDPGQRAAREAVAAWLRSFEGDGFRVGRITEADRYGDAP